MSIVLFQNWLVEITAAEGSGLDHTIVRPGHLTDDAAAVLTAAVAAPNTIGKTLEVVAGDVPVEEAVASL